MSTLIESGPGKTEKIMLYAVMPIVMILLFISLSQPVWRGDDMIAQMKSNCAKQDGVFLETKGWLSNSYECAPHLGVPQVAK